jgi:hypothetical protein
MPISAGTESYRCDSGPVRARGQSLSLAELTSALEGDVKEILADYKGQEELRSLLSGLAATGFEHQQLDSIVEAQPESYDWRVGEGLAEAYLTSHKQCEYPWPGGRDLKNPTASAAGTDLIGLQKTDGAENFRFSFGEVKTSGDKDQPPSIMYGRGGLKQQLEALRDDVNTKNALIKYLGIHAVNASWRDRYRIAARRYIRDNTDVNLFGVLVRDVTPRDADLKNRATKLNENRPPATEIELLAIYIPAGTISKLPQLVKAVGA